MMKAQLENRLHDLKAELARGQQVLADLEQRQANTHSALLCISGAIQVLEEELARAAQATEDTDVLINNHVYSKSVA